MADSSKLLTVGVLGLGAWWVYNKFVAAPAPAAGPAPAGGGAPPTPPAGGAPATVTAPTAGYNSLDQIYSRLQDALKANGVAQVQGQYVQTPWQFNYFLNQVAGIDLGANMGDLFPGCGTGAKGGCDDTPITLPQFWSAAAGWLAKNKGMSGLGHFGNLGALYGRRR